VAVPAVVDLTFRAMASAVEVILVDPADGVEDYVRRRLDELERRWSRFLPESDISRLNSAPEAFVVISPDTIELLEAMKLAWRLTDGGYDPSMLAANNAAGYTKSIDGLNRTSRMARRPSRGHSIGDVTIDAVTSTAIVPAGLGIDPGGIGKGLAADMVVSELLAAGTGGALVGVGGDLAAAGTPPTADGWYVAVKHPLDLSQELMRIALDAGGVATSSTLTRTWVQDGHRRHHVIDPSTGTCATTDLAAVTVVAGAGWQAEAHATAALLVGGDRALDYFARNGLDGVAMTLDGIASMTPALDRVRALEWSSV
jgi:thiamine biosynthesis lipoprotein